MRGSGVKKLGERTRDDQRKRREDHTCVRYIPHGVLEGPDDGVQDQLELGRGDGQEGRETLGVDCLEQVEEVGPVFWVLLKVLEEQRSGYLQDAKP